MHTPREPLLAHCLASVSIVTPLHGRRARAFGFFKLVATSDPRPHPALITAIASTGDRSAFSQLFAHFAPRINTYLRRTGLENHIAEEIAQEVMVAVWQKAHQYDPSRATAAAWIFGIAANLRIDRFRRDRIVLPTDDPSSQRSAEPFPDAIIEADETARRMREAIAELSPDQLSALHLAFFEDRSHAEIQSILGIPLGTIKSRLRLALEKLRNALKDCA